MRIFFFLWDPGRAKFFFFHLDVQWWSTSRRLLRVIHGSARFRKRRALRPGQAARWKLLRASIPLGLPCPPESITNGQTDREWKLALLDAHNLLPENDQLSADQLARKYRVKARPSVARMLNAWVADPSRRSADIHALSEYAINLNLPMQTLRWQPRAPDALA